MSEVTTKMKSAKLLIPSPWGLFEPVKGLEKITDMIWILRVSIALWLTNIDLFF